MFFSIYQSQNISSLKNYSPKPISQTKPRLPDVQKPSSPQKEKGQTDEITWIKKKHNEFDDYSSLTPINISLGHNLNKKVYSNFLKNKIFSNRKSFDQNPQTKQKLLHSQSVYIEQKRRKSQYSKFFNQTLVDTEHNFIGKSYLRQVKNCKVNPKTVQSTSVSPQKISIPKKSNVFTKQTQFTPFSYGSTTKVFQCPQRSGSLVYLNKKMSIKERFMTQKSVSGQELQKEKIKKAMISKVLIKQIQDKVKTDIKSEIKALKNLKLNKFKLKNSQSNQDRSLKKTLQIQTSQELKPKQKRQSHMSSKKNLNIMKKYSDSDMKFRQHFKNGPKLRKLQTSTESYEEKCYKVLNEHSFEPILEDLRPWESENLQFLDFR